MRRAIAYTLAAAGLAAPAGLPSAAPRHARAAEARVVVVRMVDDSLPRFEPARVVAHRGDTVRFVNAGSMAHNVDFRAVPDGTTLGAESASPFLTGRGERYDVVIDERFAPGEHGYVCTPHETLGMAGVIVVGEPRGKRDAGGHERNGAAARGDTGA